MAVVVVIPAYNESRTIGAVAEECKKFADEVIVANDGSLDETAIIARQAGARVVTHLVNRGYGAALKTGMMAALERGADIVVTIDADGQHEPSEIPRLIDPIVSRRGVLQYAPTIGGGGYPDIVIGDRFAHDSQREGMSFMRKCMIGFGNALTWMLYGVWLSDTQSGFRAYTRHALERLHVGAEGMEFSSEVIGEAARQGLRIALVPISVRYTAYSLAKGQNIFTGASTALRLFLRRITR
ncbi:hypothetical protein A3J43_03365 [Candidatus Uhrbacteria bacterium RIFCSPHIGHO2_12_FULL_54_23]|uniref:Glycosyltransferase 2-like domain-containing protein n=3 Tax=Candidatus Uhriibacteriota TaxID=1752732 RepID=A0A1F7UNA0_9BACT|nr:MAG: hypothetical protein A3J43_03365 [Candidatus Uhrbacteria bacterium RIFCSPHIGHO2_12_FULL_54_23]OGL85624.1 MAG: hypothetical protein A3B36_01865 [Candidatus Uhrbacteria bacterium RIFCSPLOWO2_01_FULL_55_36]OGL91134.1 MAG: hypothetical protein A3J36_03055 [Candidatus Uhrbacteria bacterium RIFCSPLOWO2_02_FULL_54_37]